MPHDVNGKLLTVGDYVNIPAKVIAIHQTEDFCNVDLQFIHIMPGRTEPDRYCSINTKQVILVEK